jgi:predicted PurR-regulated permease PerM
VNDKRIKPGVASYFKVVILLVEAIIDLIALPFRLVFFMVGRKKVVREIHGMLKEGSRHQGPQ